MAKTKTAGGPERVTLKFLSERIGLSRTTISLVLNDSPLAATIAPATRDYILKAAKKYKYRPNYFARYLNQRRSYLIGIVSPDLAEGYDSEVFAGIEEALLETQYQYFVTSHHWSAQRLERTAQLFRERGVEGVILVNTPHDFDIDVPVIRIGRRSSAKNGVTIAIDNEAGIREGLNHLFSLGHRKIAFLKGHVDSIDTESRWAAVRSVAKSLSLRVDNKLVVQLERLGMQQTSAIEEGAAAAEKLLAYSRDFTAVVAFNDMSAIGAMHRLRDAGLRVPDDISVVGFDDVIAARIAYPQLTTIRQPLREMGECASRELIKGIEEDGLKSSYIKMTPVLVQRDSTRQVCQKK